MISEVLSNRGYRVGLFGKWHADTEGYKPVRGFDRWLTYDERKTDWINLYQHSGTVYFSKDGAATSHAGVQARYLAVSTTANHPIRRLMDYGVPVTINSDDPSLFGIDLCHEYEILHREHGFTEKDFHACNQRAANASFIDTAEKSRVWHNA